MIDIFTDGSYKNGKAGVGVYFGEKDERNISFSLNKTKYKKSNNVAELLGIVMALEKLLKTTKIGKNKICVYSDSMYCINIINKWGKDWEKNSWTKKTKGKIENLDLVKSMYYLAKNMNIKIIHIRSHQKKPDEKSKEYYYWFGNEMADKLAEKARNSS